MTRKTVSCTMPLERKKSRILEERSPLRFYSTAEFRAWLRECYG